MLLPVEANEGTEESQERWLDEFIERYMQVYPQDSYWNELEAEAMKAFANEQDEGTQMGHAGWRWLCIRNFREKHLKDENSSTEEIRALWMNDMLPGVWVEQAASGQVKIKCGTKSYIVLPMALKMPEGAGLNYLREACTVYRCTWDMGSPQDNQRDLHRSVWQTLCLKDGVAFFDGDGLTLIDGAIYFHYDKAKGAYTGWDTDRETRIAHYRCSESERAALEHELTGCPRVPAPGMEPPTQNDEYNADYEDDEESPSGPFDDIDCVWVVQSEYIDDKEKALISLLNPEMKERLEKEGKLLRTEYDREMARYELDRLTLKKVKAGDSGQIGLSLSYRGKAYRIMPMDADTVVGSDYKYLYRQCLLFNCGCGVRKPLSKVSLTQQREVMYIKVDRRVALYHQGNLTLIDGPSYYYYDKETGVYVGRETFGGSVTRYQCNEGETRQLEKFVRTTRERGEFLLYRPDSL